jgi:hypothetical protein
VKSDQGYIGIDSVTVHVGDKPTLILVACSSILPSEKNGIDYSIN